MLSTRLLGKENYCKTIFFVCLFGLQSLLALETHKLVLLKTCRSCDDLALDHLLLCLVPPILCLGSPFPPLLDPSMHTHHTLNQDPCFAGFFSFENVWMN